MEHHAPGLPLLRRSSSKTRASSSSLRRLRSGQDDAIFSSDSHTPKLNFQYGYGSQRSEIDCLPGGRVGIGVIG